MLQVAYCPCDRTDVQELIQTKRRELSENIRTLNTRRNASLYFEFLLIQALVYDYGTSSVSADWGQSHKTNVIVKCNAIKIIDPVNCRLRQAPSGQNQGRFAIRIVRLLIQFKLNKSHASKTIRSLRGLLRNVTFCQGSCTYCKVTS